MTVKQAYTLWDGIETLPKPEDKDVNGIFKTICRQGMKKRGFTDKPEYESRLEEEMSLILKKDMAVYFIVLWDALRFCRKEGIPLGAGRGSAAGCLIAYLLEITQVDPIEYGLLFWRFLDEDRDDMVDIDIDISPKGRPKLKRYLEEKYGKDHVASVATFVYFQAAGAIRAACRVLNVPYATSNTIAKDIETMDDFKKKEYKDFHDSYPDVYRLAKGLEGRLATVGVHAGATVISRMPITDLAPTESRTINDEDFRQLTIALDGDETQAIGFVKYDFLVLKNLDVVEDAIQNIRKTKGKRIDSLEIPLNDPDVLKMLSDGYTAGVFQSEQPASTKVIKNMHVDSFNDLVVSNALVRPGAMKAFGEDYIARKRGYKRATSLHSDADSFLEETEHLALYQEQSMQICTIIAGMTQNEANQIRKITAHKQDKETLQPYKEKFIEGAKKNVSEKVADKLWADIELTAEYSFNKCLAEDTCIDVREFDDLTTQDWVYHNFTIKEFLEHFSWADGDFDNTFIQVKGPKWIKGPKVGPDTWHNIKAVHDNGVQDVWRIWTDSETYIDATTMHKHRLSKGWKEAYRIHQNDQIWTQNGKVAVAGRRLMPAIQTYDLELYDEPHAFYANGFLTHNSHAVSYSMTSMQCAWLKYYYPHEFMTSLLNNEEDGNSVSDYLAECKRLGIEVKTPDVNKSEIGYATKDNIIYMGLSNIKYVSDKLAERLMNARPFKNYKDLTDKIMAKGSGLNTRVIQALNAVGAADFPDHKVDIKECKPNYYEYLGIVSFDGGQITSEMYNRITPLSEYEDKTDAIVIGVVQDIVVKGWIRVDYIDGSGGKGAVFVQPDHGFEKGHRYIFALAKGNLVGSMDLENLSKINPLVRYLNGEMDQRTHFVAGKSRKTKTGNLMGNVLFVHNGILRSATIWKDQLMGLKAKPGDEIKIGVKEDKKFGLVVTNMKKVENE